MARNHDETRLQIATADYLNGEIRTGRNVIKISKPFPELRFHHSANEGRNAADGAKYKRMGVLAGMPDWLIWGPNKWHAFVELKVDAALSPNQRTLQHWAMKYEFPYAVCRSVGEMRDTLIGWGWECQNTSCREPNYMSQQDKHKAAMEYFRP